MAPWIEQSPGFDDLVVHHAAHECVGVAQSGLVHAQLVFVDEVAQLGQQMEELQAGHAPGDMVEVDLPIDGHQIRQAPGFTAGRDLRVVHGLGHQREQLGIEREARRGPHASVAQAFGVAARLVHGALQRLHDLTKRLVDLLADRRGGIESGGRGRAHALGHRRPALDLETAVSVEKCVHVLVRNARRSGQRAAGVQGQKPFGVRFSRLVEHHGAHASSQGLAVTIVEHRLHDHLAARRDAVGLFPRDRQAWQHARQYQNPAVEHVLVLGNRDARGSERPLAYGGGRQRHRSAPTGVSDPGALPGAISRTFQYDARRSLGAQNAHRQGLAGPCQRAAGTNCGDRIAIHAQTAVDGRCRRAARGDPARMHGGGDFARATAVDLAGHQGADLGRKVPNDFAPAARIGAHARAEAVPGQDEFGGQRFVIQGGVQE